jgi:hypothetical protein
MFASGACTLDERFGHARYPKFRYYDVGRGIRGGRHYSSERISYAIFHISNEDCEQDAWVDVGRCPRNWRMEGHWSASLSRYPQISLPPTSFYSMFHPRALLTLGRMLCPWIPEFVYARWSKYRDGPSQRHVHIRMRK